MSRYTTVQADALRRIGRPLEALATGMRLDSELEEIFRRTEEGTIGVTALGRDIDAVCKNGTAFSTDPATTTGLTYGHLGGRVMKAGSVAVVAAGTVALTPSVTNFVELDPADNLVKRATGSFTAGRLPICTILTTADAILTTTNTRALLGFVPPASITGSLLTIAGKTKEIEIALGTIAATTSFSLIGPAAASTLTAAVLLQQSTIAAHDSNYWTFALTNQRTANPMLAITPGNSSRLTGGTGVTAAVVRPLQMHPTPANLAAAVNEPIEFTVTKTGTPADLVRATLRLDLTFEA